MIRLVVSDVDGTLLKRGQSMIEDRVVEAIHHVRTKKISFAVASGRAYSDLRGVFAPLKENISYLASDGALVLNGTKCVKQYPMDRELAFSCMKEVWQRTEAEVVLYSSYLAYVVPKSMEFVSQIEKSMNGHVKKVNCMRDVSGEYLKIGFYHPVDIWKKAGDILCYYNKKLHMVYHSKNWIEFTGAGVHKGTGLEALIHALGIERSEVLAFGDNTNDMEMLAMAGYSIAMKHAPLSLKQISGSETEDVVKELWKL